MSNLAPHSSQKLTLARLSNGIAGKALAETFRLRGATLGRAVLGERRESDRSFRQRRGRGQGVEDRYELRRT